MRAATRRAFKSGSTGSGGSWIPANTGLSHLAVGALVVDPTTASTIYAVTGGGVRQSKDSGESWSEMYDVVRRLIPAVRRCRWVVPS